MQEDLIVVFIIFLHRFISNVDTARPFAAHFQGISSFDVNITNVRVLYNLISTGITIIYAVNESKNELVIIICRTL